MFVSALQANSAAEYSDTTDRCNALLGMLISRQMSLIQIAEAAAAPILANLGVRAS